MYPLLEWASSIDSVAREGGSLPCEAQEQVTVRINPAVQFSFDRIEMIGRLAEGEQPRQLREDEVSVTRTPGAGSAELMSAVMPPVDGAVATGAETPYDGALPAFQRWATQLDSNNPAVQEVAQCYVLAMQGCAQFMTEPPELPGGQDGDRAAWGCRVDADLAVASSPVMVDEAVAVQHTQRLIDQRPVHRFLRPASGADRTRCGQAGDCRQAGKNLLGDASRVQHAGQFQHGPGQARRSGEIGLLD